MYAIQIEIVPIFLRGLAALAILWLGFYLGIRFQKSKDKEAKNKMPQITIPVKTRTLEELKQELDESECYAYIQGWLTLKELDILYEAGGYELISGPAYDTDDVGEQEYWFKKYPR